MQGKAGLCMLVQKLEIQTHCSCKASSSWPEPYDVMGFQECDNIERIITDAGPRGSSCFWLVSVCWEDAKSLHLCQALLECVQDCRMNTPEFKDLHAHQTQSGVSCHGQSVNSMFANVCSYHLELHASSCGRILDGHLSPARLGIAYRKVHGESWVWSQATHDCAA